MIDFPPLPGFYEKEEDKKEQVVVFFCLSWLFCRPVRGVGLTNVHPTAVACLPVPKKRKKTINRKIFVDKKFRRVI